MTPPVRASRLGTKLRVGAAVIAAAAILLVTLTLTGPCGLTSGQPLAVDFGFAGPIKKGAAVRVAGVVVGTVDRVEFLAGQDPKAGPDVMVRVHALFEDRAKPILTTRAKFYVTTLGVLGEHYLDLNPSPGGTPLAPGAVVRGTDLARADLLLQRAAGLLEMGDAMIGEHRPQVVELVQTLSALLSTLNETLQSADKDALAAESKAILQEVRGVLGALNTALGDGSTAKAMIPLASKTLARADGVMARLDALPVEDIVSEGREALSEGRDALGEGRSTLKKVDGALDGIAGGPLVDAKRQQQLARTFEKTFVELEVVAARADRLLKMIEQQEGAVGEAFHDKELVTDLKAVLKAFRESPMKMFLP